MSAEDLFGELRSALHAPRDSAGWASLCDALTRALTLHPELLFGDWWGYVRDGALAWPRALRDHAPREWFEQGRAATHLLELLWCDPERFEDMLWDSGGFFFSERSPPERPGEPFELTLAPPDADASIPLGPLQHVLLRHVVREGVRLEREAAAELVRRDQGWRGELEGADQWDLVGVELHDRHDASRLVVVMQDGNWPMNMYHWGHWSVSFERGRVVDVYESCVAVGFL